MRLTISATIAVATSESALCRRLAAHLYGVVVIRVEPFDDKRVRYEYSFVDSIILDYKLFDIDIAVS